MTYKLDIRLKMYLDFLFNYLYSEYNYPNIGKQICETQNLLFYVIFIRSEDQNKPNAGPTNVLKEIFEFIPTINKSPT